MSDWCEHEFDNANCTNCANGLPSSAYECAKTRGVLKEYIHDKATQTYREKYNAGYEAGYDQGRTDERERILGMVDWKQQEDFKRRKLVIEIDYDDVLNGEQVASIICEKLKELGNE